MDVFAARNSANACNNARINPFLSEGMIPVEGFIIFFFFISLPKNGGGLTLNRNPVLLAEQDSMSLYLL